MNQPKRVCEVLRPRGGKIAKGLCLTMLISVAAADICWGQTNPVPAGETPQPTAEKQKDTPPVPKPVREDIRRRTAPPLEMNPNAKWACDQTTAVAKPAWRGSGRVEFPFKIRNEGTAPLLIRAKGG